MDSISKEILKKYVSEQLFEETVNNVKLFYETREKLKSKLPVIRISMVRMKENDHEVKNFSSFWGKYADEIFILIMKPRWLRQGRS